MCLSGYANLCLYCFPKEEGQTYLVADFIRGRAIGKVLNYFRTKDMHLKSRKKWYCIEMGGWKVTSMEHWEPTRLGKYEQIVSNALGGREC